jgi:hypothetical protein
MLLLKRPQSALLLFEVMTSGLARHDSGHLRIQVTTHSSRYTNFASFLSNYNIIQVISEPINTCHDGKKPLDPQLETSHTS